MRPRARHLPLLALAAACAQGGYSPTGVELVAGLEQVVEVQTSADGARGSFAMTSTLRNTADAPVTVRLRSCYLRTSDLRGDRSGMDVYEPLMLCATSDHEVTLGPGESSETLTVSGTAPRGATYALELRHVVSPERWAPVSLEIP